MYLYVPWHVTAYPRATDIVAAAVDAADVVSGAAVAAAATNILVFIQHFQKLTESKSLCVVAIFFSFSYLLN